LHENSPRTAQSLRWSQCPLIWKSLLNRHRATALVFMEFWTTSLCRCGALNRHWHVFAAGCGALKFHRAAGVMFVNCRVARLWRCGALIPVSQMSGREVPLPGVLEVSGTVSANCLFALAPLCRADAIPS